MKKILFIFFLFIGFIACAQVPTVTSQKFRPQASPPSNPVEGHMYYDTDGKFYYYKDSSWLELGTDQDNILRLRSFVSPSSSFEDFATMINNMDSFQVNEKDIPLFYASVMKQSGNTSIYSITLKDIGKNTYGMGGVQITKDNILLIADLSPSADIIEKMSITQKIDLGNRGISDIVTIFNSHTFTGNEVPVQQQNEGYVLIDVIINGQELQYLFVGTGGLYGSNGTETATDDDFVLLTDIETSENTQFVEIGEIGENAIEDVFNVSTNCINIQPKSKGYVVVNTLINGTKVQYLFLGPSGSYGDGCANTATSMDFTSFTPLADEYVPDDLFHVTGSQHSDTGVRATLYNQNIIHGGNITANSLTALGGPGSSYQSGINNQGYNGLYVNGNTSLVLRSSNPNNGSVRVTSNGQVNVESSGSNKATLYVGRNFNNGLSTTNTTYRGLVLDDNVDLSNKTASRYTAFHINPTIGNMNGNTWHSIISERGDIDFRNGLLKLSSYDNTMPVSENATAGLGLDNNGNVVKTILGGGGTGTGAVDSVFGRTGNITAQTGDYTVGQVTGAQPTLISGTNIKTINGEDIMGSGNLVISGGSSNNYVLDVSLAGRDLNFVGVGSAFNGTVQLPTVFGRTGNITSQTGDYNVSQITNAQPTLVSGTNIKTINNQNVLGSGNINIASNHISNVTVTGNNMNFTGIGNAFNGSVALPVHSDAVDSVFGRTGAVTAQTGDYTVGQVTNAQETLVSGTNIKTVNGETLLGSTDIEVQAPLEVYSESGTLAGGDAEAKIGDFDTSSFSGSGLTYNQNFQGSNLSFTGLQSDQIFLSASDAFAILSPSYIISELTHDYGGGVSKGGINIQSIDNIITLGDRATDTPKVILDYSDITGITKTQSFQDKSGTIALLPTSQGTAGQFLQTDGNDNVVWATPSGGGGTTDYISNVNVNGNNLEFTGVGNAFNSSVALPTYGDVYKVGTPVNSEIPVWSGDGTLTSESNFKYEGGFLSKLTIGAEKDSTRFGWIELKGGNFGNALIDFNNNALGNRNSNVLKWRVGTSLASDPPGKGNFYIYAWGRTPSLVIDDVTKSLYSPNTTIADINTIGAKSLITKEYADATYNSGGGGSSGDMLKSVYDTNNNGIVDNSSLVNGLTVETAVPAGALFTDTVFTPSNLLTDYSFTDNSSNWDTAYGWGNHASAGYSTQTLTAGTNVTLNGNVIDVTIPTPTVPNLQSVATQGATTTTSLTATKFVDSNGTDASSGTVLTLDDNITGTIFNETPSSANIFTVANLKKGGWAVNYITTAGKTAFPTVDNAIGTETVTKSDPFRADATYKMVVSTDGTNIEYFFIDYLNTTPSGGDGVWGSITGTLSDQTDLQNVLNTFSTQTLTAGSNINISGNVISATDTNTTYTAGAGISIDGSNVISATGGGGGGSGALIYSPTSNTTGIIRSDRNQSLFGAPGLHSVDFSYTDTGSSLYGALGDLSTCFGSNNEASGPNSTATGTGNKANGNSSFVANAHNQASGFLSTAFGTYTTASGESAFAMGYITNATGQASSTMGSGNTAASFGETVVGVHSTLQPGSATTIVGTDRAFNVGVGTSSGARADGLTVLKDGTVTAPSLTNVLIDTAGDTAVLTKGYGDTNYKLQGYTVATLPAGSIGDTAYVTDATSPTYLGALVGGGSVVCPVFHNGTTWVSH